MSQSFLHIAEAVSDYLIEPSREELLAKISAYSTVEDANIELRHLTGIRYFFPNQRTWQEFQQVLSQGDYTRDSIDRQWGDFQTPHPLASRVCGYLAETGVSPQVIIEPTYGAGNFIDAALAVFPQAKLIYGVEIQEKYEWHFKISLLTKVVHSQRSTPEIELYQGNIFTHRFSDEVLTAREILIIGNPPWITNSELGILDSDNLPTKRNIKALNGLDALTGKSNFDLAESILLHLLETFTKQHGTIALLCKNAVIKNLIEELPRRRFEVANIRAYEIDTHREFGAAVKASLLVMDLGQEQREVTCRVAPFANPGQVTRVFGWLGPKFVSDIANYSEVSALDGESPVTWRQGLKHDCAGIMELDSRKDGLINGNGETVDIESEWVYALLKSSDLRTFEVNQARKKVIVTQHSIGEETAELQITAPKLWQYLDKNSNYFARRKSRIYEGKPRFSIFGIGEYSFRPYKVAISSLYKHPYFALVCPVEDRPAMLDDTCYFLGFDSYLDALFTASLLNSSIVQQLLRSIAFADAKRPYTKEVLMRIDLCQVVQRLSFGSLHTWWSDIGYQPRMSVVEADFEDYIQRLRSLARRGETLQLSLGI